MNRFAAIFLLSACVLLAGCVTPDVKYSDLSPPTTATASGDAIIVHIGSDLTNSACFTRPEAKVEGRTVFIVGYRTLREQGREFVVRLRTSVGSRAVAIVWIDPDGSRIPVPITK